MNNRTLITAILSLLAICNLAVAGIQPVPTSGNYILEQRLNSIQQFQKNQSLGFAGLAAEWSLVKKETIDIRVDTETGQITGSSEFEVIGNSSLLFSFISADSIITWNVTINGIPVTVVPIEYPYYEYYYYIYFEIPPHADAYQVQTVRMEYTFQQATENSDNFSYISKTNGFSADQYIPSLYDDAATRQIEMTLTLKSDLTLLVGGKINSQTDNPDETSSYSIDPYSQGNRSDTFIYGNFKLINADAGSYGKVEMFLDKDLDGFDKYADFAAYALEQYAIRFRMYSPYQPLRFAQVKSGMFGGLSSAGLILLNLDAYRDNGESEIQIDELIAHEMAHQYWGNYSVAYGADVWLTESMAEYQSFRLMGERHGQSVEDDFFASARGTYLDYISYSSDVPLGTAYINVYDQSSAFAIVYEKGACIHKMLEKTIGQENYDLICQSMLAYREQGEYRYVRDFWQYTDLVTQGDYGWFFEDWIYKAYYPRIYFDWNAIQAEEGNNQIQVYIEQWTPNYELPIEVAFISNRDTFIVSQWLSRKLSQTWDCTVPFIPEEVVLDPKQIWIMDQWRYDRTSDNGKDQLPAASIQVMTNPFKDYLTIEFTQEASYLSINKVMVYNLKGESIAELAVAPNSTKLVWNAIGVPAGMYYLSADNTKIGVVKIVKIE